ncbi:hypothetical protein ABFS83_04G199100 [Erythranthe nasuta]
MMFHHPHRRKLTTEKNQNEFETATDFESYISSSSSSSSLSSRSSTTPLINQHHQNKICRIITYTTRDPGHDPKQITGSGCFSVVSPKPWEKLKLWFGSASSSMAAATPHSVDLSLQFRNKKQQKREELEREVTVLHKMLANEQKVNEYLERIRHRKDGSALAIPNFLPSKMKEILAELAMVENEITRLESQIKHLRDEMQHEKESYNNYKEYSSPLPPNSSTVKNRKNPNENVTFETKALHFISKAIKGDYHLSDFNNTNDNSNNGLLFSNQKENKFQESRGIFREKVSKRNGILKNPSPLREPRHLTPRRDRNLETPTDIPPRVLSTPLHSVEENIQRWPPNKLSENIMKCLVFVFVRLLRTSRVMELEKSGPISRSTSFSLSFRATTETGPNSKTGPVFQKESRQQDPYGIFDSEDSVPRDIGPYKNLVRFTSSSLDLKCIQNSSSVPLFQKLKILMDGLQKVDLRFLSHQQKLAFWINMYNACIMHGYLQYGIPTVFSPDNLLSLIKKSTLNIAGNTIDADSIEHFILRKPQDSLVVKDILNEEEDNNKQIMIHELYGLNTPDPNIAFALCCGTRSSPAVKIYTGDGVVSELEKSKLEYLQAAIMVKTSKKIAVPELLLRNMADFAAADREAAVVEWLSHQLPTAGSLRKSIVDCCRGIHGGKALAHVDKIPYEFEFQYLLAI